jgi:hypothetical protein
VVEARLPREPSDVAQMLIVAPIENIQRLVRLHSLKASPRSEKPAEDTTRARREVGARAGHPERFLQRLLIEGRSRLERVTRSFKNLLRAMQMEPEGMAKVAVLLKPAGELLQLGRKSGARVKPKIPGEKRLQHDDLLWRWEIDPGISYVELSTRKARRINGKAEALHITERSTLVELC